MSVSRPSISPRMIGTEIRSFKFPWTYGAYISLAALFSRFFEPRGAWRVAGNVTTTVYFDADPLALIFVETRLF